MVDTGRKQYKGKRTRVLKKTKTRKEKKQKLKR